jgi:glycosyltransferase involved in cell wall biosynthesis
VELHLAGVLSSADRAAIFAELRNPEIVKMPGYLAHDETVALLRSADLLFLPMHGLPRGRRARIVPGKTYEYLAAGRPILAAVPDGDARDLLGQAGAVLCRPTDVECLASALSGRIDGTVPAVSGTTTPKEILERYERRALTSDLAVVLDRVASRFVS